MIKQPNDIQVLVLGDIILDEYISTSAERISPEAPIPVAKLENRGFVLGGAANVAHNLAMLGYRAVLSGVYGNDAVARELDNLLHQAGIQNCIAHDHAYASTLKSRVTAKGQQLLRIDDERPQALSAEIYRQIFMELVCVIPECSAVILSDYNKGVFWAHAGGVCIAQDVIALCRKHAVPVCVDPKGKNWDRYAHASCVTPNASELKEIIGVQEFSEEDIRTHAVELCKSYHLQRVLVTRGKLGMALIEASGEAHFIPTTAKDVIDISGAGDTVISVLAGAVAGGLSWHEAAMCANLGAGVVVSKSGTSPISRAELEQALSEYK